MASDTKKLAGKAALITGGGRGIGRAVAAAYAREGAQVFICGRDQAALDDALGEMRKSGAEAEGSAGDIGNAAEARRIVSTALACFGAIDILVNNASVLGPRLHIAEYPLDAWEEVIRVNLNGLFFITREVLPKMLERRTGSIINVTSGVGRTGKARWGAYAVSKGALENFTQVLADELKGAGIRVNSVNPAATRTRMRAAAYPAEDPLTLPTAEQLVPLFLHLAADVSADLTGQSLDARDWVGRGV